MANDFTPTYFFDVVSTHLSRRDDFWHIVNGPKREVWFVAESIAALSRASAKDLKTGHRVYGEEKYSSLIKMFRGTKNVTTRGDLTKIPDITIASSYASRLLAIVEAKLCDDFDPKELDAQKGHLQYQLDMARRVFPRAKVLGVIFAVHHLERAVTKKHVAVNPLKFYEHIKQSAEQQIDFKAYKWCFPEGIRPVPQLQNVPPLGGMFNGQASLGIGLIQPKGQKYVP